MNDERQTRSAHCAYLCKIIKQLLAELIKNGVSVPFVYARVKLDDRTMNVFGLSGLVASRLAQLCQRPAIIFTERPNSLYIGGSGRNPNVGLRFDLQGMFQKTEILVTGGGHRDAAGFLVLASDMQLFVKKLEDLSSQFEMSEPKFFLNEATAWNHYVYDDTLQFSEITEIFTEELSKIGPFGKDFPSPTYLSHDVDILSCHLITDRSYSARVAQGATHFYAFYSGDDLLSLAEAPHFPLQKVTILYTPFLRYSKTKRSVMLRLEKLFLPGASII